MGLEERKQTKEIDGVTYEVTPLPFGVGQKTLMRTIKIMSPIMSAMMKGGTQAQGVALALEALPIALSDADVTYFGETFGKASRYQDGDKWVPLLSSTQELHFAGRYLAFMQWITFCLEVNFKSFFSSMKDGGGLGDLFQATPQ